MLGEVPMPKKPKSTSSQTRRAPTAHQSGKAEWGLLSDAELARPGATLMNLILTAAADRRLSVGEVTEILGVSYAYFFGLRSGKNDISKLGDEHITRAAKFLRMPKLAVLLAAGRLKHEDFYIEPAKLQDYLQPALRFLQQDPEYAAFVPASLIKADPAIQQFVMMLYERATGRTLIPGRVSHEEIVKRDRSLLPERDNPGQDKRSR